MKPMKTVLAEATDLTIDLTIEITIINITIINITIINITLRETP